MIVNLRVKNVALIDEAEVQFSGGLNILTGETGAGKSMLIDSINFLLGERPGKDFIRSGTDMASVEGLISLTEESSIRGISELGVEPDDEGQILLFRALNMQGRSTCRINGRNVNVGMLKEISAFLVDVHGQHQHQSLLDSSKHIILLDSFCGEKMERLKEELSDFITTYRETVKTLRTLQGAPGQREAQMELLQFQIMEINELELQPGEENILVQKRNRLSGVDKLAKNATEALSLLSGGESDDLSASDQIGRALYLLEEIANVDTTKQSLAETLAEIVSQLSDVVGELGDYAGGLDADPHELERLEARLDSLYRLKRKYSAETSDGILVHLEKITEQYDKLENMDEEIAQLNTKRRKNMKAIADKCNEMTNLRQKQADMIQGRIVDVLKELGMPNVQFAVSMEKQAAFTAIGNDKVEFMISPNLGEGLKPLSKIASGGEMSRVMLAMKTVMADADGIETLIFDEIDAGVSGRTAQKVAEKLAHISRGKRQILCITHLPQIAAMADSHFWIAKGLTPGQAKTRTTIRELPHVGIIQELARLIGGAQITAATVQAAEEMKSMADEVKKKV